MAKLARCKTECSTPVVKPLVSMPCFTCVAPVTP
jgi:hypothetical protein